MEEFIVKLCIDMPGRWALGLCGLHERVKSWNAEGGIVILAAVAFWAVTAMGLFGLYELAVLIRDASPWW